MAFPVMSLCPDSKRSLNLSYFPKKHGSKVLDKGSDVVRSTNSVPDIANNKESKFYAFCRQPSFHSKSKLISPYESFVVSGFLGSKSQVQLVNSPKISCLFNDLVAGFKNCNFSSVSSSPKKKIAKEVSLADPAIVNTSEFPCVINEHRLEEQLVAGFKQSYAEVASIPIKPGRCVEVMSDRSKQNSRNSRRFQSGGRRSSSRKSNRTDRTERLNSVDDPSHSSQSQEISPNLWKDLRLNQQEKHFNRLKNLVKSTNKKLDRLCSTTANPSKPDNLLSSGSRSHSKRRSNYRSHRDGKRGLRAKNSDCDIDKINWRTGEPICDKMGGQHVGDESEESLATNLLSMEFCPQGQGTNVGDQMMQEILPIENVSRTDSSPRGVRRSFSSECSMDSEDSFIIFQPSGAPSDTSSDFASDWSDYDSDDSFESDSDASDEEDSCDGKNTSSPRLKEVNDLWDREYPLKEETSAQNSKLGNKEHEKKVHFRSKPVVHRMLTWDLAYRLSRPGPWEQIARDRERFHTRIQQFECILSPVLSLTHRNKIWNRLITQQKS